MMEKSIEIKNRKISNISPAFIVAEAACNHMCDIHTAKKMIDEAKNAGADAIKFQTYKAERLVRKEASAYWNYASQASQFEYYKNLDKFGKCEYKELFSYAAQKELIAFSTPFDVDSASLLNDLGAPLFKIASCDILDVRLIKHVASFRKPMIVSTGGSTFQEIQKTVDLILSTDVPGLILMACTLTYPAQNDQANLRRILTFQKNFPELIIGYSDHTPPDEHMVIPAIAVSLGAKVIEKHYTLNRSWTGSGHAFSINAEDLKKMVVNIRLTEAVLGEEAVKVYAFEETARKNARRSLVAQMDIQKGKRILDSMIGIKRPATGLSPDFINDIIGKTAKCDIPKDTPILWESLES